MDYKDIDNGYKIYESLPEGELKESLREVLSYADSCYVSDAEETATGIITNVEEIEDRIVEAAGELAEEMFHQIDDFTVQLRKRINYENLNIRVEKEV